MVCFYHQPVLLEEAMEALNPAPGGIYVDCTVGGGGHSLEILRRSGPDGKLIALDQDPEALAASEKRLRCFGNRVILMRENFVHLPKLLNILRVSAVDGIIYDLGVSSHQLDCPGRGFSYIMDGPLDMRMDPDGILTAKEIVNTFTERELKMIIRRYGEEKWAGRVASLIVRERRNRPVETTGQLAEIVKRAVPTGARERGGHPAKRTFQALRITVNNEMENLKSSLQEAVKYLKRGSRICIISFHSLEDRLVKNLFLELSSKCVCPPGFPVCVCHKKPILKIITKRAVRPSPAEVELNPRSSSARLRVAESLI